MNSVQQKDHQKYHRNTVNGEQFSFQRTSCRIAGSGPGEQQIATSLCGNTPDFPPRSVLGCTCHSEIGHGQELGQGRMEVVAPSGGHWWRLRAVVRCRLRPFLHLCGAGRRNLRRGRKHPTAMYCLNSTLHQLRRLGPTYAAVTKHHC